MDISTRQPVEMPTEQVRTVLNDLDRAGNNAWFDSPGKRDARLLLSELDQHVRREFSIGAMLAEGHSRDSLRALKTL